MGILEKGDPAKANQDLMPITQSSNKVTCFQKGKTVVQCHTHTRYEKYWLVFAELATLESPKVAGNQKVQYFDQIF